MKRSRENIRFWKGRIAGLFKSQPKSQLTENRYKAVMAVMVPSFPWIKEIPQEDFIHMLSTASYLEREMRRETEGRQNEIKEILSQGKQVELYK